VEVGGRVVPDDAEEGEVAYVPTGQAPVGDGAAEGSVAGEGREGQRLGAAREVGYVGYVG
jgi:hypothetical protein